MEKKIDWVLEALELSGLHQGHVAGYLAIEITLEWKKRGKALVKRSSRSIIPEG